ncbi:unnamed protein product [Schistocephalus solidus]|uniref:Glutamate receptor 1 n=1 Tax=Schistocephalus solidus TaxID=70667 RepID=A0A183SXY3_SCHSO|nr:unnamed protein product [Schistocephalus solidus]
MSTNSAIHGLWLIGLLRLAILVLCDMQELNVGFIIEGPAERQTQVIQKAITAANRKLAELLAGQPHQVTLVPLIKRIDTRNAFAATKAAIEKIVYFQANKVLTEYQLLLKACDLLMNQVITVFGPGSTPASTPSLRITQKYSIPYVVIQWSDDDSLQNYSINLHPSYNEVGRVLRKFIEEAEDWKQLGIIYAKEEGKTMKNYGLEKFESLLSHFKGEVIMRKWHTNDMAHKYVIKYFRTTMSHFRFLVDIPHSEIPEFLDLDTQFLDPKTFAVDKGANFSAISLTNVLSQQFQSPPQHDINRQTSARSRKTGADSGPEAASGRESLTYYLLLYDTLHVMAVGISRFISTNSLAIQPPLGLSCSSGDTWSQGPLLLESIKSVGPDDVNGFTGYIQFDEQGRRKGLNISVLEINRDGFQEVSYSLDLKKPSLPAFGCTVLRCHATGQILKFGYWNEIEEFVVTKKFAETQAEIQKELTGQTLRVTTIEDTPFIMYKGNLTADGQKSMDPKDWHGFCIDLLNECAAALHFNYTVHPVAHGSYGKAEIIDGVEVWDGIIGELQFKRADLAVAMLTINYEREKVIDFTTPFMNLGVSIIFKKPVGTQVDLFSFLRPLSPPVWGYVLIAYVGVSMALFFVARFSPYEWRNPHPCNADSEVLENSFNMLNSLWFTLGSLMQKGSDILPRATSTRIVAGFWWFFTLIIISSYTANLAAFLTVERMKAPIEDVNDLAKQTKIKYGTREGGSSAAFFEKSNLSVYQRMWQFMSSNKNVMMNSTTEAIARVKRGGYAYILESSVNEYYTQRNCELMQVGNNLDSKGYGIGFPQGSKYRDSFSEVILQLQRSQTLEQMRRYWWGNYSIVEPCNDQPKKSADATSLGVEQVGGCFVMVLIGLAASFLVGLAEFLYKAYQRSKITKASQYTFITSPNLGNLIDDALRLISKMQHQTQMSSPKRSMHEEVAREFRFSMARSSTRDVAAESALKLPQPPSKCIPTKECRSAAMAYAPCLPATVRPAGYRSSSARFSDRRLSVFDVTLLHRRCSSNRRSRSSTSSQMNTGLHTHLSLLYMYLRK